MKNTLRKIASMQSIAVIAVTVIIVLTAVACGTTGSSGVSGTSASTAESRASIKPGLTITGLDKWNGMRIQAENDSLYAAARVINANDYDPMRGAKGIGAVIENGTATLNVWNVEVSALDEETWEGFEITSVPYTGNDTMEFYIDIWEDSETYHWHFSIANGTVTAAFSGGAARAAFVLGYESEPEEWD